MFADILLSAQITFIRPIHLDALRAFVTGSKHDIDEGVILSATQARE